MFIHYAIHLCLVLVVLKLAHRDVDFDRGGGFERFQIGIEPWLNFHKTPDGARFDYPIVKTRGAINSDFTTSWLGIVANRALRLQCAGEKQNGYKEKVTETFHDVR